MLRLEKTELSVFWPSAPGINEVVLKLWWNTEAGHSLACGFFTAPLNRRDTLQSLGTTAKTSSVLLQDGVPVTLCLMDYEGGFCPINRCLLNLRLSYLGMRVRITGGGGGTI